MEDLSNIQVDLDRRILDFLIGFESELGEMVDGSYLYQPNVNFDDIILPEDSKKRILEVVMNFDETRKKRSEYGMEEKYSKGYNSVILLEGASGTGKTATANAIGTLLKKKILLVNFPSLPPNSAGKIISFLFREAKINKALLFFDECENLFADREKYHNIQINQLLTEIEKFDGLSILCTNRAQVIDSAMHRRISTTVHYSKPDHFLRERIWRSLRPEKLPVDENINYAELAKRFELQGGFIKNCWLSALNILVSRKKKDDKIYQADLEKAAQEQIVGKLGMSEFEKKVTPQAGFDSIMVEEKILESLKEIAMTEKASQVLFGQWGFGNKHSTSRGLPCLLYGESGTGKTLAASAIGFELGKCLKVISAASLTSKWVGETAKNIEGIFNDARKEDSILVIDEAEALFASRESDTSRHDTLNTGVLLQQIENYDGVIIVITNMKSLIDQAFMRRFRFVLKFESPDAKLRKKLWRCITPKECPLADDVNFDSLSQTYETTGGQIKQILLRAATRAALRLDEKTRKVTMADLEKSCREEQEKSGNGNTKSAGMYL